MLWSRSFEDVSRSSSCDSLSLSSRLQMLFSRHIFWSKRLTTSSSFDSLALISSATNISSCLIVSLKFSIVANCICADSPRVSFCASSTLRFSALIVSSWHLFWYNPSSSAIRTKLHSCSDDRFVIQLSFSAKESVAT